MQPGEASARSAEFQLLDVREPQEWDSGHIADAAHIPMGQLAERLAELDPARPVLAICRSGQRSGRATSWLLEQGYEAHNLEGGLLAWHAEGLPLRDSKGETGTVA